MNPNILMAVSAAIVGLLGLGHLILTIWGPKLLPRDPSLKAAMSGVAPLVGSAVSLLLYSASIVLSWAA